MLHPNQFFIPGFYAQPRILSLTWTIQVEIADLSQPYFIIGVIRKAKSTQYAEHTPVSVYGSPFYELLCPSPIVTEVLCFRFISNYWMTHK